MKKHILKLGIITSAITPVAAVVSCGGTNEESANPNKSQDGTIIITENFLNKSGFIEWDRLKREVGIESNGGVSIKLDSSISATKLAHSIDIPKWVTEIADEGFQKGAFDKISLPNTITKIGDSAFSNAVLTSLKLPDNLTKIGDGAFSSSELTALTLPHKLTSIGNKAFSSSKLIALTIPDDVTSIGDNAFRNSPLTSLVLNNKLDSIGAYAFKNHNLSNISLPNSITKLGEGSFMGVDHYHDGNWTVTNLKLSKALEVIPKSAFKFLSIDTITIPESVVSIGESAFRVSWVKTINWPQSGNLKHIGPYAFWDNNLKSIIIPDGVQSIGAGAFERPNTPILENVFIPDSVTTLNLEYDPKLINRYKLTMLLKGDAKVRLPAKFNNMNMIKKIFEIDHGGSWSNITFTSK